MIFLLLLFHGRYTEYFEPKEANQGAERFLFLSVINIMTLVQLNAAEYVATHAKIQLYI